MSAYIEKLARAASDNADRIWGEAGRDGTQVRADVIMVRSVLMALAEPSEAMLRAGGYELDETGSGRAAAGMVFGAMIDAALSE